MVFCDAPCSGSGTWRRDPEGKWSITLQIIKIIISSREYFRTAAKLVKPNGNWFMQPVLVLKDENKAQIQKFLTNSNEWVLRKKNVYAQ